MSCVRAGWMWRKARIWKKQDLQIEDTWCSKVSLLSKVTPKVLSVSVVRTLVPATSTDLWSGSVWLHWWVLSQIASDLSGFKASPFMQNHSWSLDRQRSRQATDMYWSDDVSEMKSWVSSAYCWWWIPMELMWPTGEMKVEKRRGPSTDPCGTPVDSEVPPDFAWPTTTRWTRSTK